VVIFPSERLHFDLKMQNSLRSDSCIFSFGTVCVPTKIAKSVENNRPTLAVSDWQSENPMTACEAREMTNNQYTNNQFSALRKILYLIKIKVFIR